MGCLSWHTILELFGSNTADSQILPFDKEFCYCSASVCFIFSIQNQKSVGNGCNLYFNSIILLTFGRLTSTIVDVPHR